MVRTKWDWVNLMFPACAFEKAALFIPVWLTPIWEKLELPNLAVLAIDRVAPKLELPRPLRKCVLADIKDSAELLEIAEDRAAKLPPVPT